MITNDLVVVNVVILNFIERAHDSQIFLQLFILRNYGKGRWVMFLVICDDVSNQWTLTG